MDDALKQKKAKKIINNKMSPYLSKKKKNKNKIKKEKKILKTKKEERERERVGNSSEEATKTR